MIRLPPRATLFPYTTLFRSHRLLRDQLDRTAAMVAAVEKEMEAGQMGISLTPQERFGVFGDHDPEQYEAEVQEDRKSTRRNSSHANISYAVFCLQKK